MVDDENIIRHLDLCKGTIPVGNSNFQWLPKMRQYAEMGLFIVVPDDDRGQTLFHVTETGRDYFEFMML